MHLQHYFQPHYLDFAFASRGLEAKAEKCFLFGKCLSSGRHVEQIIPFYVNHERGCGNESRVAEGYKGLGALLPLV